MRVVPSPRCTKASKNPVQECTSNSRSGRSILGSIFSTRLRSQVSDFGSPSAPSFSTFSFARPPGMTSMDGGGVGQGQAHHGSPTFLRPNNPVRVPAAGLKV